jgi:hypothetical protein
VEIFLAGALLVIPLELARESNLAHQPLSERRACAAVL